MKKLIFTTIFISSLFFANAQADLSITYGYQFGARTWTSNGTLRLLGSDNFGAQLDVYLNPDIAFSLTYIGANTSARIDRGLGIVVASSDVMVNYYQIGGTRILPVNQKLEGLGMFTFGASQFAVADQRYSDEWRFSITFGLGAKIWLTDVVGLRVQARLLAPINWAGLGFFCGTGGCGTSVNAGSTFVSGDIGGGLVFKLGK